MTKPDKELASRIVKRLREANTIAESTLQKIDEGLSEGTLDSEGWKLIVELEVSEKKGKVAVENK